MKVKWHRTLYLLDKIELGNIVDRLVDNIIYTGIKEKYVF